jgi:hypothetical protein
LSHILQKLTTMLITGLKHLEYAKSDKWCSKPRL